MEEQNFMNTNNSEQVLVYFEEVNIFFRHSLLNLGKILTDVKHIYDNFQINYVHLK